ncbi:MAG: hypothetical protein ACUZ8I_12540 [Candidatus Scalindua sp.]
MMKKILFVILIVFLVLNAWADERDEIASILKESDRLVKEERYDEALELLEEVITEKYPESQELIMKLVEIEELRKPGTYTTVEKPQEADIYVFAKMLVVHIDHYYDNAISYLKQELEKQPDNEKIKKWIKEFEKEKAFWETAKEEYPRHYKAMEERKLMRGMPEKMVRFMLKEPDKINRSVGSWGVHEQWIFEEHNMYLYLEDGFLTSWQK